MKRYKSLFSEETSDPFRGIRHDLDFAFETYIGPEEDILVNVRGICNILGKRSGEEELADFEYFITNAETDEEIKLDSLSSEDQLKLKDEASVKASQSLGDHDYDDGKAEYEANFRD